MLHATYCNEQAILYYCSLFTLQFNSVNSGNNWFRASWLPCMITSSGPYNVNIVINVVFNDAPMGHWHWGYKIRP